MQNYTNLCLIFLISSSFGLCAMKPKELFADPYDRTPKRVSKRVVRADKKEMNRMIQAQLFDAAGTGNIKKLKKLYGEYGELDIVSDRLRTKGLTPIYKAVEEGKLEAVAYLSQHAFMTRLFPRVGSLAVSGDVAEGSQAGKVLQATGEMTKGLESNTLQATGGGEPQKPQVGEAALEKKLVLPRESDENSQVVGFESLLDVAIRCGHTEVALFLAQFIPLWMPNGEGKLPVCNALRCGRPDIAKALILAHASNVQHLLTIEGIKGGHSPLSCALALGHKEVAALIAEILAQHKPKEVQEKPAGELAVVQETSRRVNLRSPWLVVPGLCLAGLLVYVVQKKSAENQLADDFSYLGHMMYFAGHDKL